MRPLNVVVLEAIKETPTITTLRFDRSVEPAPGQYAMIWKRGEDEKPMCFSGPNQVTVQAVGITSQILTRLAPGESVGIRGPLGNGFVLRGNKILLVGGGVGVAPLAFLGEQAKSVGIEVTSLLGFRSSNEMIFKKRFEQLGDTIITTDDGSAGIKGRAAEGLKKLDIDEFSQIYLCGPELMMLDIITRAKQHASKIQASINRYFKCGIGVCGSCCIDPDGIRVCVEGPVIMADRLLETEFGKHKRSKEGVKYPIKK
jgi:dihydroorotate dehydrogenase electron transfer subunit